MGRWTSACATRTCLARFPTFIGFYVGRQDSRFRDPNHDFNEALNKAHVPHLFRTYPSGHSGALWRGQAMRWLDYALDALARGA
jgi:enterochelin esterase-like enzyme